MQRVIKSSLTPRACFSVFSSCPPSDGLPTVYGSAICSATKDAGGTCILGCTGLILSLSQTPFFSFLLLAPTLFSSAFPDCPWRLSPGRTALPDQVDALGAQQAECACREATPSNLIIFIFIWSRNHRNHAAAQALTTNLTPPKGRAFISPMLVI